MPSNKSKSPLINENKIISKNKSNIPPLLNKSKIIDIVKRWKEDNYPDSPDIVGMMNSLERVYPRQYDKKEAREIIEEIFKGGN